MVDWIVPIGAAVLVTGGAFMFGDLAELLQKRRDPRAVVRGSLAHFDE